MLANTPAMLEAHYGIPMAGAVLNALNTRLDAAVIAFTLDHAEAKVLITDREFSPVIKAALALAKVKPLVIDYDDPEYGGPGERLGTLEYEDFLSGGDPDFAWRMPDDEWDAIALNYTSGTTGDPKGVVYHHRGAYLLAMANVLTCAMGRHPVYLWTLPMFHCNGWCFPWTVPIVAGVNVCLRQVRAAAMYDCMARHKVTHLCGAPIVMSTLLNAPESEKKPLPHTVEFVTAAAPPPEAVLAAMRAAGFNVTHVYGLTEVYGPASVNEWHTNWDALPPDEQAARKARQGVRYPVLEGLDVLDPDTMQPVPRDGETLGEVMFRGNVVMRGYLKNKPATDKAFAGGWFHSGDLGVMHPDGYIQLKDRSKDIIISGGENISSIEVEDALYKHPAVQAAAVVAKPDDKWGETPCAFVELKPGSRQPARTWSPGAASISRPTNARATWCSPNCRRRRRGRSRNSGCARWRRRREGRSCRALRYACAMNAPGFKRRPVPEFLAWAESQDKRNPRTEGAANCFAAASSRWRPSARRYPRPIEIARRAVPAADAAAERGAGEEPAGNIIALAQRLADRRRLLEPGVGGARDCHPAAADIWQAPTAASAIPRWARPTVSVSRAMASNQLSVARNRACLGAPGRARRRNRPSPAASRNTDSLAWHRAADIRAAVPSDAARRRRIPARPPRTGRQRAGHRHKSARLPIIQNSIVATVGKGDGLFRRPHGGGDLAGEQLGLAQVRGGIGGAVPGPPLPRPSAAAARVAGSASANRPCAPT